MTPYQDLSLALVGFAGGSLLARVILLLPQRRRATMDALRIESEVAVQLLERTTKELKKERSWTYKDGRTVSEFYIVPCMCMIPDADCVRPDELKPGDQFSSGPQHDKWVVVDAPQVHGDEVCIYAYRDKPRPLYHFFYLNSSRMHRERAS